MKLSRREFIEMKKKALIQLKHIILGYDIGTWEEDGCLRMCKGYEKIEVVDAPVFTGLTARIVVTGNGFDCINICQQDVMFLENHINILKELVYEILRSRHNPRAFDKEKIKEAYFAVQDIQMYLEKLYPFTEADS
jgi:hypothetical protein